MFDDHSPIPLYHQLKTILEEQINSDKLKPGDKIPSEKDLCECYNISRTTVRQALNELVSIGKLIRVQGRGTFVSKSLIKKPYYRLAGFTSEMKNVGRKVHSQILKLDAVIPPEDISQKLRLRTNEPAVLVKRLRFADDNGVQGIDISYLPFKRFEGLLKEDLKNNSLYEILITKYDTIPTRGIQQVKAVRCPSEYHQLLKLKPGEPVIYFREVVHDQKNLPFEHAENIYRGDRYTFNVEIYKRNIKVVDLG